MKPQIFTGTELNHVSRAETAAPGENHLLDVILTSPRAASERPHLRRT
jgi:hypothetical protein